MGFASANMKFQLKFAVFLLLLIGDGGHLVMGIRLSGIQPMEVEGEGGCGLTVASIADYDNGKGLVGHMIQLTNNCKICVVEKGTVVEISLADNPDLMRPIPYVLDQRIPPGGKAIISKRIESKYHIREISIRQHSFKCA